MIFQVAKFHFWKIFFLKIIKSQCCSVPQVPCFSEKWDFSPTSALPLLNYYFSSMRRVDWKTCGMVLQTPSAVIGLRSQQWYQASGGDGCPAFSSGIIYLLSTQHNCIFHLPQALLVGNWRPSESSNGINAQTSYFSLQTLCLEGKQRTTGLHFTPPCLLEQAHMLFL